MTILEIPVAIADFLVYLIPVIVFSFIVIIIAIDRKAVGGILGRLVSFLINPFSDGVPKQGDRAGPSMKLKLAYLSIIVFLSSNLIGAFYYIMADVAIPITQGSNGLARTISIVILQTPFHGGWIGTLPWYGGFPLPLGGIDLFHEPWSWILFTSVIGDNPDLFSEIGSELVLYTLIVGIVFLIPLLIKPIRKSFAPSMFLLTTSMVVSTRAILGCLALVLKIGYFGGTLQFGTFVLDGSQMTGAVPAIIGAIVPWALGIFAGYLCLGFLLSRTHFREQRRSQYWLLAYVAIAYWLGLIILMW
ncbi:MAG: hypothetical protein JSW61_10035 [Candidatus Thorarchaeota archaeon]|nr:MAG: hypothetical protein JSW61_10035 [Candidatus Thorarchaeota archaeon]